MLAPPPFYRAMSRMRHRYAGFTVCEEVSHAWPSLSANRCVSCAFQPASTSANELADRGVWFAMALAIHQLAESEIE